MAGVPDKQATEFLLKQSLQAAVELRKEVRRTWLGRIFYYFEERRQSQQKLKDRREAAKQCRAGYHVCANWRLTQECNVFYRTADDAFESKPRGARWTYQGSCVHCHLPMVHTTQNFKS